DCNGRPQALELECAGGAPRSARLAGGATIELAEATLEGETVAARLGARRFKARCYRDGERVLLWCGAEAYELRLDDPRTHEFAASAASGGLTTPLPGVVVAVPVAVGQEVAAGDALMVIEAMKMEHTIAAPYAGTVASIHFARGDRVPEGRELLELTRAEA
ncbi:MAG TPA: biotin/lipoyl-containing protein, partial [Steroidobacteraceae bacterium]|nr:biotin/lipoyl-containing protein [Steroidobacteraceae bacterium]